MFKGTTISALVLSIAIISAQSPTLASVYPTASENIQADIHANIVKVDIGQLPVISAAISTEAEPMLVAWSLKGAYKKAKKGVKKAGRATGRVIRKANRKIVPLEIRNGASYVYGKTKKAAKHIYRHPYGKRCKPNKFLQPVCTVKGKGRRANTHDHRS